MRLKRISQHLSRLLEPTRVFIVLILVALIYLLPFDSKPEFIEHNGQIISVPQSPPILRSLYPEASYATCGQNGTGTNCQTGCCSAGQCVQCPPEPEDSPPSIQSALNCSQPGDNGWCRDSLSINLSASDPQGYSIIISGVFSGNAFACPVGATSCSIPVNNEEQGTISYRVDSSSGMAASGTRDYKVDRTTPQLDGSVSCVMGTNNWCRSNASLTVSASDSLSGIASITTTIDGGAANAYTAPIILSEGVHSVTITARDNAGNISQSTQIIQVDTLTPTINASLSGKNGKNSWYVSNVSLTSSANDGGSGIASLEVKIDNGTWTAVNGPATLPNGIHTWQLRATDNAGNLTETPVQTTYVDTVAPAIDMTEEIDLGDTLYYSLEDPTINGQIASGLSVYRAVIEDDEERYQKVVWLEALNGNKLRGEILWDGKFKDGTLAGAGDYFITLKIADAAGNETVKSAVVHVHVYSFLQELPAFTPPASGTSPTDEDEGQGNITSQDSSSNSQTEVSTIFGGVSASVGEAQMSSSSFGVESSTTPITNIPFDPSILWGAAAVALVGSTLAEWERQREEERKRREAEEAKLQKRENTEKRRAQKAQEAAVRERWAQEAEEKTNGDKGLHSPVQVVKPTPMPPGLSPEAQAAFLHGGTAAASWIGSNASTLQAQYVADLTRQKEKESQKALEDFRAGERASSIVVTPKEDKPSWLETFGNNMVSTVTNTTDNISRLVGTIPDAWRGFLLAPLQIKDQVKGSNLVVSVNQKTLDVVSNLTNWVEKKLPWLGVEAVPENKLGYYESLAEQGLDINPTGNLNPKTWTDKLLAIVLGKESKTLVKETTEEIAETATKSTFRDTLKAGSPAVFDAVIEGSFNAYDYIWGEKKNETDKLQKWAVSSGVDLGGSLITGGAAALTVAGVILTIGYIVGAPVTVPATLVIGGTIIVGVLFDMILESTGVKNIVKDKLNEYIDYKQSIVPSPPLSPAQPPIAAQTPSFSPVTEVPVTPTIPPATMTPTPPSGNNTSTPTPTVQVTQTPEP